MSLPPPKCVLRYLSTYIYSKHCKYDRIYQNSNVVFTTTKGKTFFQQSGNRSELLVFRFLFMKGKIFFYRCVRGKRREEDENLWSKTSPACQFIVESTMRKRIIINYNLFGRSCWINRTVKTNDWSRPSVWGGS